MTDRLQEIRARLDLAGTFSVDGPDNSHFIAHAPADMAWLLERESQMMGALAVMTDLAAYDGGAVGRESLDECLRDFGFTLEEVESRDGR